MEVIISKKAQRQYSRLPKPEQLKVGRKLKALEENPLAGEKLSGDLEGDRSLRAWPYRIIYSINKKGKRIEVSDIVHRQSAYN